MSDHFEPLPCNGKDKLGSKELATKVLVDYFLSNTIIFLSSYVLNKQFIHTYIHAFIKKNKKL